MPGFSVISDVSAGLLRLLRGKLCPDSVQSPESIQLASPADKNADFQLGLFLYDIRELGEYRRSEQVRRSDGQRAFPPRPLTLCYLLFLNSKAQIAAGAEAEQRILGRALQALTDYPAVYPPQAPGAPRGEGAALTLINLSFEDKSKVWSALTIPYQAGLYFSASPVLLESTRSEPFVRVREADIIVSQRAPGAARAGEREVQE